jgi:hypothetical protein
MNGVIVWRGGVFVTAAPDILYLKHTDGDGIADERRVVLTGFENSRTAQIRSAIRRSGSMEKSTSRAGSTAGKSLRHSIRIGRK